MHLKQSQLHVCAHVLTNLFKLLSPTGAILITKWIKLKIVVRDLKEYTHLSLTVDESSGLGESMQIPKNINKHFIMLQNKNNSIRKCKIMYVKLLYVIIIIDNQPPPP